MLGFLTGGFSKYIMMGLVAAIVVLMVMMGFSKYKVSQLETKVSNLKQEIIINKVQIKGLEGDIKISKFINKMREEDNKILDDRNKIVVEDNENLLTTIEDLSNAKLQDDSKIDPVLDDFLNNR